jgi:hypothetical protein
MYYYKNPQVQQVKEQGDKYFKVLMFQLIKKCFDMMQQRPIYSNQRSSIFWQWRTPKPKAII